MQSLARTHWLASLLHGAREVGERHRLALVERSHARVDAALHAAGGRRCGAARRGGGATAWSRRERRRVSEARSGCRAAVEARTGGVVACAAPQLRRRAEARARGCAQRLHIAPERTQKCRTVPFRPCLRVPFRSLAARRRPFPLAACSCRTRHGAVRALSFACARFAAPCARKPSRASLCAPLRIPRSAFLPPPRIARLDEAAAYIPRVRYGFLGVGLSVRPPRQRTAWVLSADCAPQRRLRCAGAAPARGCRGRQAARAGAQRRLSA
jgi:hypothetical protein